MNPFVDHSQIVQLEYLGSGIWGPYHSEVITMDVPRTLSILVVHDEAPVLFTLDYLLQHYGYDVTPASNGAEAIANILRNDFDLLLIDLQLPDFSGLDIARCAREHQQDAGILFLAGCTAYGGTPVEEQIAPFDCITKAASPQEVVERVASAIEERAKLTTRLVSA